MKSIYTPSNNIKPIGKLEVVPAYKLENIFSMANEYKDTKFEEEQAYKTSLIAEVKRAGTTKNDKRLERTSIQGLEFLLKKG